jgi:hypothetical protein
MKQTLFSEYAYGGAMKPSVKKKWLEALRSGKYKQARGTLRKLAGRDAAFCCLGVLCELHRKAVGTGSWSEDDGHWRYLGEISRLPREVAKWAGLESYNPEVSFGGVNCRLSTLNDGFGGDMSSTDERRSKIEPQTFENVALIIEEQL